MRHGTLLGVWLATRSLPSLIPHSSFRLSQFLLHFEIHAFHVSSAVPIVS